MNAADPPLPRTELLHPEAASSSDPRRWLELFDRAEPCVASALSARGEEILSLGRAMAAALGGGGRIIHAGAGTSGRLGALDAAEWPPTFGVAPGRVLACVAGGSAALTGAVEGAEDDAAAGARASAELGLGSADLIVGISASGSAPWLLALLAGARERGARRALISAAPSPLADPALLRIELDLGAELLAGSTRLAAATATHRVLQRASCLCAVELGWIHRGRMVELRPTNEKLRARARRIVAELARIPAEEAARALARSEDDIKVAIVSAALRLPIDEARRRLAVAGRRLSAFEELA